MRLIGYWKDEQHPNLPDPASLVDATWDQDERIVVSAYFVRGTVARAFMGLSPCRICGVNNGSVEYTDGVYLWPEGFVHYIYEHGVRPPSPVVAHAMERMASIEADEPDLTWWVDETRPRS